jgi:hypothetical protein
LVVGLLAQIAALRERVEELERLQSRTSLNGSFYRRSRRQIADVMRDVFGCPVSVGAVDAAIMRMSRVLADPWTELRDAVRAADAAGGCEARRCPGGPPPRRVAGKRISSSRAGSRASARGVGARPCRRRRCTAGVLGRSNDPLEVVHQTLGLLDAAKIRVGQAERSHSVFDDRLQLGRAVSHLRVLHEHDPLQTAGISDPLLVVESLADALAVDTSAMT